MSLEQNVVVDGCAEWASWWLDQRAGKLESFLSETMTINPLMAPLIVELHGLETGSDLVSMLVTSHLMIGHATGFGKLIDEKVIPNVFGARKLNSSFRRDVAPFSESCFDDIDHLVVRPDGTKELISLKASTWTIQLASAVQLNRAFGEIMEDHSDLIDSICLSVFVGRRDQLSDKYDIARGVNRGANHSVKDLTSFVSVRAGREFWSWLNDGENSTQDWVLQGFLRAAKESAIRERAEILLENYVSSVSKNYPSLSSTLSETGFVSLMKQISG